LFIAKSSRMGNACGSRGAYGKLIFWTSTVLPPTWGATLTEQQASFTDRKKKLEVIGGKAIYGWFHTQQSAPGGNQSANGVGKVFYAWDSASSFESSSGDLASALGFGSTGDLKTATNDGQAPFEGKLFMSCNQYGAERIIHEKPQDMLLGIGAYHLTAATPYDEYFKTGFQKKADQIAAIPGATSFGYFINQAAVPETAEIEPVVFVVWDNETAKEEGKGALWNIMMAVPEDAPKQHSDHSVHTMASGGMFKEDSTRTYHQGQYATGPK